MAQKVTANYSFPKRTAGIVAFKNSFENAMDAIDAKLKEIDDRVTAVEGGVAQIETDLDDSNSQFIDNN